MDVSLGHVVTANGELVKTEWDILSHSRVFSKNQEVCFFENNVTRKDVDKCKKKALATKAYSGMFQSEDNLLHPTVSVMSAQYTASIAHSDSNEILIRSIVLFSGDEPWALCRLAEPIYVRPNITTIFGFETRLAYINDSTDYHLKTHGLASLEFRTSMATVKEGNGDVDVFMVTDHTTVSQEGLSIPNSVSIGSNPKPVGRASYDDGILTVIVDKPVKGLREVFVRVVWNLGMVIRFGEFKYGSSKQMGLTLNENQQTTLKFNINLVDSKF